MRLIGYVQDSTADGEGLRDVLFFSHCTHRCEGCHNPEAWNKSYGKVFTSEMKDNLIKQLKRLGTPSVTLSGGDPLSDVNYPEMVDLCREMNENGINI